MIKVREGQRGYIVFMPHCNKVVVRRHVYFREHDVLKRAHLPLHLRDDHAPVNFIIKHKDSDSEASSTSDSSSTSNTSITSTHTQHSASSTTTTDDDDVVRTYRHDEDPFDSASP